MVTNKQTNKGLSKLCGFVLVSMIPSVYSNSSEKLLLSSSNITHRNVYFI